MRFHKWKVVTPCPVMAVVRPQTFSASTASYLCQSADFRQRQRKQIVKNLEGREINLESLVNQWLNFLADTASFSTTKELLSEIHMTNHSENLNGKIAIKLGKLEIEFSGSEDYIRNGLPELIDLLFSYPLEDCEDDDDNTVLSSAEEAEELPENPDPAKRKLQMTTNSISARLAAKTGPDLVLAACAHLTLVKGADTFERKNILAEM